MAAICLPQEDGCSIAERGFLAAEAEKRFISYALATDRLQLQLAVSYKTQSLNCHPIITQNGCSNIYSFHYQDEDRC
jgi:hypothetical protein